MAIIFSENFESGSSPWGFDSEVDWGGGTLTLDTSGKVAGQNSIKIIRTGAGGNFLLKTFGLDYAEIYLQFKIYVPSDWNWGSATFGMSNGFLSSGDGEIAIINFSNEGGDGNLSLTLSGVTWGWHDSGIDLVKGVVNTIEVYYKFDGSTGIVRAWLNNGVEGSPNYEATNQNTGTAQARKLRTPEVWADDAHPEFFIDDFIVSDSFIGLPAELEQEGFLWRADDGDEDEASPLESQDVNITRAKNINTRLRVLIDAIGNPPSKQFQLEYRKKGTDTWNKL